MLASLAGAEHVLMVLYNHELRVVLVSDRVSSRDAIAMIDVDAELRAIRWPQPPDPGTGIDRPRIAVAGLNRHVGEARMFGDEDDAMISPGVHRSQA
jgi:4-hydroxythreonine-4-phosphate dehydrogenase